MSPPGVAFEALPRIDAVAISHDHYDHLDLATVKRLMETHNPYSLVPLGLKAWLAEHSITKVEEADWWQEREHRGVRFVCLPAQHFSQRTLSDANSRLWASWAIIGRDRRFYFGGDTGYFISMATKIILPAVRRILLSAVAAAFAGAVAAPSFVAPALAQTHGANPAGAGAADAAAATACAAAGAGTGFRRRPGRRPAWRRREHLDLSERQGRGKPRRGADAGTAGRLAVPGLLRRVLQGSRRQRRRPRLAEGAVARFGLRHRCREGHRHHQQPCDRRRRRDRSQLLRRLEAQGRTRRHRHQDRHRGAQGRPDTEEADGGQVRRFQQDADRRLGHGDRQPVRARRHGDGRHHFGP